MKQINIMKQEKSVEVASISTKLKTNLLQSAPMLPGTQWPLSGADRWPEKAVDNLMTGIDHTTANVSTSLDSWPPAS